MITRRLFSSLQGRRVVITGGRGNIGAKLCRHFLEQGLTPHVIENEEFAALGERVDGSALTVANLDVLEEEWQSCFDGAAAVVHLSAVNPYGTATWNQAGESLRQSCNVFNTAVRRGVPRVVFASSNHVMGGYKECGGGELLPDHSNLIFGNSIPLVGTKGMINETPFDYTPYASAKFAAEQLATALGNDGSTSFVSLRIGWCQPGENLQETCNAAGHPGEKCAQVHSGDPRTDTRILNAWFKNMWLSNEDLCRYFTAALHVPLPSHGGHAILNAMSANKGSRWDLSETKRVLQL